MHCAAMLVTPRNTCTHHQSPSTAFDPRPASLCQADASHRCGGWREHQESMTSSSPGACSRPPHTQKRAANTAAAAAPTPHDPQWQHALPCLVGSSPHSVWPQACLVRRALRERGPVCDSLLFALPAAQHGTHPTPALAWPQVRKAHGSPTGRSGRARTHTWPQACFWSCACAAPPQPPRPRKDRPTEITVRAAGCAGHHGRVRTHTWPQACFDRARAHRRRQRSSSCLARQQSGFDGELSCGRRRDRRHRGRRHRHHGPCSRMGGSDSG